MLKSSCVYLSFLLYFFCFFSCLNAHKDQSETVLFVLREFYCGRKSSERAADNAALEIHAAIGNRNLSAKERIRQRIAGVFINNRKPAYPETTAVIDILRKVHCQSQRRH